MSQSPAAAALVVLVLVFLMLVLSVPWAILVFVCVIRHWHTRIPHGMISLSAAYPTLYLGVAWGMSLWRASAPKGP